MSGGIGGIVAYLGPNGRSIGTIVPDVVIEEAHRDPLILTQHPVEKGAAITDHAFATPSSVVIRCGFSNSTAADEGYARAIYAEFLAWRASRDPRDVSTGKRSYKNMLPADIAVVTDPRTENVLALTVLCQEVIITSTQRTGGGQNQADPASTGGVTDRGTQSGTDVGGQAFTGAFSPGSNEAALQSDPYGFGNSGLSPSTTTGDVGPLTVDDGTTGQNIFDDSNGANGNTNPFTRDPNLP